MKNITKYIILLIPWVILALIIYKGRQVNDAFFIPPQMDIKNTLPEIILPEEILKWKRHNTSWFPAEKMYEKIDGRDQFFQQYGASGLLSATWQNNNFPEWDMLLYKLKGIDEANAVFINNAESMPVKTDDDIKWVLDRGWLIACRDCFYLEMTSITESTNTQYIIPLAQEIMNSLPVSGETNKIQKILLPKTHKIANSENFISEDAFGFSSLQNIHSAEYNLNDTQSTRFIADGNANKNIFRAFTNELFEYGASNIFSTPNMAGGEMYGSWIIAGITNNKFYGIFNAPSQQSLLSHWNEFSTFIKKQNEK